MYKTAKEFESAMRSILIKVRDGEKFSGLTDDDIEAFGECSNSGYVTGVQGLRTADNKLHISQNNPSVTYSGLKFIEREQR